MSARGVVLRLVMEAQPHWTNASAMIISFSFIHPAFERQRSGDAPLVARTQQRLVRLLVTHLSLKIYGNTQRLFAYNIQ